MEPQAKAPDRRPDRAPVAAAARVPFGFALLAVVVAGTYWREFRHVTVVGLAFLALGWKHRESHSLRGAIAFIGLLVTIYGVLGWYVVIRSR